MMNILSCRLSGNPTCTGTGLTVASPTVCNATTTTPATKWTSPLVSNNCTFCETNGRTTNPHTCVCSYPLIVTLEVRAPTFTTIDNDTLWDELALQTNTAFQALALVSNIKFETDQLWVRDAFFNASTEKAVVRLFFFPLLGDTMDKATESFITRSFTLQKVAYTSPFKPDIVQDISNSQGTNFLTCLVMFLDYSIGIAIHIDLYDNCNPFTSKSLTRMCQNGQMWPLPYL